MTPHIQEVTIECADPARLAEFWGKVLQCSWGYQPEPGGVVDTGDRFVFFQAMPPEELSAGNRFHFDVVVEDMEAAAVAAEVLGATRTGERFDDPAGGGFITMRDPESNAFCFVSEPEGSWTALLRSIVNQP